MSGHSKWATTKHRKGAQDAKRSALFGKLSRQITVAAKEGGDPNPDNNAALAAAIAKAKSYSLPNSNIESAIKNAFGRDENAANFESIAYEGYGPAGIAVYVECLTDNRNRTAADVRSAFTHSGGNLGTSGSVAFQFDKKGEITVEKSDDLDEDSLMMAVAEAGGEDYEDNEETWAVWTDPTELMAVSKALEAQGVKVKGAELTMIPNTPVSVDVADAKKVLRLVDKLEDLDDVQNVYHTMELSDEVLAALDE
ncbi:MAG: YebC/PmpR family DNA-binding transcriptional regulator [Coriobacteriia bacterium]|nr:YebC/PmpR family DNA-binding transcriptional regulator [Coriobacteriia bacterium]